MIEFDLDIPSLTKERIQMSDAFISVKELSSSSMIDELIMIEILLLLINSFDRKANIFREITEKLMGVYMNSLCLFLSINTKE